LKEQVRYLKSETAYTITATSANANPRAVNQNNTVTVSRTLQVSKNATSGAVSFAVSDFTGSLQYTPNIMKLDWIKVWNGAANSWINASLSGDTVANNVGSTISYRDSGTSSSLAGVHFRIPLNKAVDITALAGAATVLTASTSGASDLVIVQFGTRVSV